MTRTFFGDLVVDGMIMICNHSTHSCAWSETKARHSKGLSSGQVYPPSPLPVALALLPVTCHDYNKNFHLHYCPTKLNVSLIELVWR
jgi:hypothetical protein